MSSILIVEDEKHLADGLRYNLEAEGFSVDAVADAENQRWKNFKRKSLNRYDVVVLDVMLPVWMGLRGK
jgi:two-component system OmpR family response regulator